MWKNISNEEFYNGRKPEVKIFEKAMKAGDGEPLEF